MVALLNITLDEIRRSFCLNCHDQLEGTCPFLDDDEKLRGHLKMQPHKDGAFIYVCDSFRPAIIDFIEGQLPKEAEALMKKYNIEYGKEYMISDVMPFVMELQVQTELTGYNMDAAKDAK